MSPRARFTLLLACFVLSGLSGLVYQTAWIQEFGLVFGASELAVVAVLAAYMGGLALGAGLVSRIQPRIRRPVLAYALLELGIAVAALLMPLAIGLANRVQVALFAGTGTSQDAGGLGVTLFHFAAAFALLAVPTGFMGATLPLLVRHAVRSDAEIGPRVGLLYGANTLGAALGTLLAAFVLLPNLGLDRTIHAAIATNVLVFVCAAVLARGASSEAAPFAPARAAPAGARWILPLVLVSGGISFSYEVLWTRLLAHVLGGSVYAFGAMLTTFLVGLTLGSALAARVATSPRRAALGFALAEWGMALASLGAYAFSDRLPALAERIGAGAASLTAGAFLSGLTLLPGAIAVGATFPFAVRVLAHGPEEAPRASALVFAWNTAGAIAGAILSGFVLLPALEFTGTLRAGAATSLVLAALAALLVRPRATYLAALSAAGGVVALAVGPGTPWNLLRHNPLGGSTADGEVRFYEVGRTATVVLGETDAGSWRLTTNGLPEASIQAPGTRTASNTVARWLALLAHAARPEARSLFVVGLGGGITVEDVPASFERLHVIELEPEVVAANRVCSPLRRSDPLADPRLVLHVNDARSALLLTDERFDAVVSQPSHPWTAGAAHLYTREFFGLVRERLTDDGVFVQWMGLRFVDAELVRCLVATLCAVFPHVEVFVPPPGFELLFVASPAPLGSRHGLERSLALARREWNAVGVFVPEDIESVLRLDAASSPRFAEGAPVNRDRRNLLQTRSPRVMGTGLARPALDALLGPWDPLRDAQALARPLYLVRRLAADGDATRAKELAERCEGRTREVALALLSWSRGEAEGAGRRLGPPTEPGSEELALRALLGGPDLLDAADARLRAELEAGTGAAFLRAWKASEEKDWAALRSLDPELARIDAYDPLQPEAIRLRVRWRVASKDPQRAAECEEILLPLLGAAPQLPDLVLRAVAAAGANDDARLRMSALELVHQAELHPGEMPAWVLATLRQLLASARGRSGDPQLGALEKRASEARPRAP